MHLLPNLLWQSLLLCAALQQPTCASPISHVRKLPVMNTGSQTVMGNRLEAMSKPMFTGFGPQSISKVLHEAKVIPDMLPSFNPKVDLKLQFLFDKTDVILRNIRQHRRIPAGMASVVPLPAIADQSTTSCAGGKPLTLVLLHSEATSLAGSGNWIVTGLQLQARPARQQTQAQRPIECVLDFSNARDPFWKKSEDLADKMPPTSPLKAGKHRYTFVLLEEKEGKPVRTLKEPAYRLQGGDKFADWTKDNNLVPIGASFFSA